ncbi:hypothetical protein I2488_13580 [Novosphingobium sp. 1Y9A]|uniref:Uncharacterized protein n=1 Tax=Novosphingobium jiangmenense TaxID=2791981 RepID=A0ABS0HIR7_9SPHN|nr:hypothetical protein [Novosphingobium jiangmenense]
MTPEKPRSAKRLIDWIWTVRDEVPVPEGMGADEALARIAPVFERPGYQVQAGTEGLSYANPSPAAQDTLSVFEKGALRIEDAPTGKVLRYRLTSRIMLFCFLLPFVFIGFGQLTLAVADYQKAKAEAKEKAEGTKKDEKKDEPVLTLHPIDKFLGAPAPEKPKDGEGKSRKRKPSATAAYVFSAFFAILFVIGRSLEPWLVRRMFRRRLAGEV